MLTVVSEVMDAVFPVGSILQSRKLPALLTHPRSNVFILGWQVDSTQIWKLPTNLLWSHVRKEGRSQQMRVTALGCWPTTGEPTMISLTLLLLETITQKAVMAILLLAASTWVWYICREPLGSPRTWAMPWSTRWKAVSWDTCGPVPTPAACTNWEMALRRMMLRQRIWKTGQNSCIKNRKKLQVLWHLGSKTGSCRY